MNTEFTFYVAKETISHLNIYKGDKIFKKNGKLYFRKNGREIPSWLNVDSDYFKVENEPYKYNVGETVKYTIETNTYKQRHPDHLFIGVVTNIDERSITIKRDNSNGMIDNVPYHNVKEKINVYYFIDSKGKIQSDYVGKDVEVDKYRKKVGNFYESKDLAREARNKIG